MHIYAFTHVRVHQLVGPDAFWHRLLTRVLAPHFRLYLCLLWSKKLHREAATAQAKVKGFARVAGAVGRD